MTPRPLRIAQTSKEAQKAYKKNGPRIPTQQLRALERGVELDNRAACIREQEKRKVENKRKREEKERKEREARRKLGVGLATQMVGYSHTQAKLKSGMESFLGLKKREAEDKKRKEQEERAIKEKLEAIIDDIEKDKKEPWDDSDGEDAMVDLPMVDAMIDLPAASADTPVASAITLPDGDHWIDDDLDDDSMLQMHDLMMSDTVEMELDSAPKQPLSPVLAPVLDVKKTIATIHDTVEMELDRTREQPPPPVPAPVLEVKKPVHTNHNQEFVRIHGPINKAIEDTLKLLPEPLVELLSQDASTTESWNPDASLLHKLNPAGLPPHRLRLKVGCVVSLLRDLNHSSQLSKSGHLRVLRIEQEWLECLVLDGQLEGTKAFITRIGFPANYRNDEQFAFTRMQFPIRVSTKYTQLPAPAPRESPQSTFKIPSIAGQSPRPPSTFKKPALPTQKLQAASKLNPNPNPSFKLPALPAPRITKASAPSKAKIPAVPVLDGWDDFLDSGTQIARELSSDDSPSKTHAKPALAVNTFVPLSTQDLDFDMDDLEDVVKPIPRPSNTISRNDPTKPPLPRRAPRNIPSNSKSLSKSTGHIDKSIAAKPTIAPQQRPPPQPLKPSVKPLNLTPQAKPLVQHTPYQLCKLAESSPGKIYIKPDSYTGNPGSYIPSKNKLNPKQNSRPAPAKPTMAPPPSNSNPLKKMIQDASRAIRSTASPPQQAQQPVKRKAPPVPTAAAAPPPKRLSPPRPPPKPRVVTKPAPAAKSLGSLSEFGLSTQDAILFFEDDDDDDDMAFGSPLVMV